MTEYDDKSREDFPEDYNPDLYKGDYVPSEEEWEEICNIKYYVKISDLPGVISSVAPAFKFFDENYDGMVEDTSQFYLESNKNLIKGDKILFSIKIMQELITNLIDKSLLELLQSEAIELYWDDNTKDFGFTMKDGYDPEEYL